MKTLLTAFLAILCAMAGLTERAAAKDAPSTVFAAASLGDALQSALADYPGETVISLGGSGAIARQVSQGAPADVVLLANPAWMDWLEDQDLTIPQTRKPFAANRIVLAGPKDAAPLETLTVSTLKNRLGETGRLAIGEHRSVPAGQYSEIWLRSLGLWQDLRPHLAEVENVRAALTLVARGEVPLAIIYASDLAAAPTAATVVWNIPTTEQPEIRYDLAAVTENGTALAAYLAGPKARAHFLRFGFAAVAP